MRNKFLIAKMAVIQKIGMRNKFLIDKVRDIIYQTRIWYGYGTQDDTSTYTHQASTSNNTYALYYLE